MHICLHTVAVALSFLPDRNHLTVSEFDIFGHFASFFPICPVGSLGICLRSCGSQNDSFDVGLRLTVAVLVQCFWVHQGNLKFLLFIKGLYFEMCPTSDWKILWHRQTVIKFNSEDGRNNFWTLYLS